MIQYDEFTLANGLRFLVHRDATTPMVAMNIIYDVGARDEQAEKTGFAHLFEHLMFGGSIHIPKYDEPLQKAGGENNAFTNSDITNYYLTIPKHNIETAFWLESDRMLSLAFSKKSLEVQRQVVVEEFRQNYLNQPYGDIWLLLKPLAYQVHPYQWNTIGKEISHIEEATLSNVQAFYATYYNPNNAIVVLVGDVETAEVYQLAEKWFGPIEQGPENKRNLPKEPQQKEARRLEVERDVPQTAIYKAWHMCGRMDEDYIASDLISDLLGSGKSSQLYKTLVRKEQLFSDINAFVTGDIDPGLLIVTGKLMPEANIQTAEQKLNEAITNLFAKPIRTEELRKVKNKVISGMVFSELSALNKAMNLAYYALLGNPSLINTLIEQYEAITPNDIARAANVIFRSENCSTLIYKSAKNLQKG